MVFLDGMTLDYKDSLMQSGFVFENPHAKKSCGCGTSFSAVSRPAGMREFFEAVCGCCAAATSFALGSP